MSYITIDNLNSINAELSNYCNAACPMCARYDWNLELVKNKTNNSYTSLELIKNKIGQSVVKRLKQFYSCGTYGDGATNPECLEIYEYLRTTNNSVNLNLSSNGGTRNKEFWRGMAELDVSVTFAIDGLEDTNHLYRRNVEWSKLMENVKSFIEAGGKAKWKFMRFKHNENQVEQAREIAKKIGFTQFSVHDSERWKDFDAYGNFRDVNEIKVDGYKLEKPTPTNQLLARNLTKDESPRKSFMEQKITCQSCSNGINEIYLMANGYVSPCCYVGDLDQHEPKNIIKDFDKVNLNKTDLESILNGDFFKELEKGIQGVPGSYRLQSCYWTCKNS